MTAPFHDPKGGMHPEDKRNLIIFFIICIVGFFLYDTFIYQPKMKAAAAHRQAVEQNAAQAPTVSGQEPRQEILTRDAVVAQGNRVAIDNPDLLGSLSLKGGRLDDLSLKQYFETVEKIKPVTLLAPSGTAHPLYVDFGWLTDAGVNVATPNSESLWRVKDGGNGALSKDHPVTIVWNNGRGLIFERTFSLDDQYMFTLTRTVTNTTRMPVSLRPYALISRQGMPADFVKNAVMHEGPIGFFDRDLHEVSYKDLDKKSRQDFEATRGWAGFTDKYWFTGIIPPDDAHKTFRFIKGDGTKPSYQIDLTSAALTVPAGSSASETTRVFVGPKKLDLLNGYKKDLNIDRFDLVIDFGKFWFLTIPFFHILTWLGHTFGSFAPALLLFTCLLRLAVFPLANKSYRSFARMRKIQPQMLEIREKYGDDRAKLQQAIFELYKRENVNPMAGCLPILIQIPIFFALYKVLYITLEMRHAPFWGWIADMSAPDPTSVFNLFGLIPWTPPSALQIGIWPIIMGITLFMQQRMNPPAQDPIQARVLSLMPVMITFLMAHFPAGLVIYWSWSNCLSIIQQYVLMKKEGVEVHFFKRDPLDKKMIDAVSHGPNIHPELEPIEHEAKEVADKVEKAISPPKPSKKR